MMESRFEYYRRVYRFFMKLPCPSNCLLYPFLALYNSYKGLL